VFSQTDSFKKRSDLNVRPIPEWRTTIVFDPAIADLVQLTPAAGLLLELCGDGQALADIQREFVGVVGARLTLDEAHNQVQQGLRDLVLRGLVMTSSASRLDIPKEMVHDTACDASDMVKMNFGPAGS
jgi:hypothetical protein